MPRPTLGYWDCRGLGEPIRFALHHAGVDFEDKRFGFGLGPDFEETKVWFEQVRPSLGLDFPNLPYYVDGDVKFTQSLAILRHVARQHGLVGKPEHTIRLEMAEQQANDWAVKLINVVYDAKSFEESRAKTLAEMPKQLHQFAKFLGDGHFVAGDYVTYVDFMWYNILDFYRLFDASHFEKRDVINNYLKRIEELPNIASYMASAVYNPTPFSPFAQWEGKV
ncbi:Glutathione S-transferase [Halotydeus destructor]|nr:Glutathione S-transferase [Halotydeus destructor]